MIGTKKLSTIKAELRQTFRAEGLDRAWFNRQIRKLEKKPRPNPVEIETLTILRDARAEPPRSLTRKPARRTRARSR